ncbi:UNKNOWN [Stylonychia lemnae]|uniref:Calcium uniporter protein C-terminal domain-containing protein n=1 Tax=Stylonychia lemnae TaxID=5949 RepID=A0A078ATH1_STYLE|nr:UNKNOWN [Stylonychia lemnae]|eukprot:CDW84477.1 UNKNOWN [Stylonychia lemnae]
MNLLGSSILLRNMFSKQSHLRTLIKQTNCIVSKPQSNISYLQQDTAQRFNQIDAEFSGANNQFQLKVILEAQTINLSGNLDQSLKDLAENLQSQNSNLQDIQFYTLDGAIIPKSELLNHRDNIPFILTLRKVDTKMIYSYALNLNSKFSIVHNYEEQNKQSEESYLQYTLGIGLPKYSSFLLANFANKLHHSYPKTRTVKTEDILKGLQQTMNYYRSVGHDKSLLKVSEIEKLIDQKQRELVKLNEKRSQLYKKADFRAQLLLFSGSSIFIAQCACIMSGTFIYYSWDIMEPISYLMMFANFTVGVFYYALFKKDLELGTLRESLAKRFSSRLYRRHGLDVERLELLESEIIELRQILNKSIY